MSGGRSLRIFKVKNGDQILVFIYIKKKNPAGSTSQPWTCRTWRSWVPVIRGINNVDIVEVVEFILAVTNPRIMSKKVVLYVKEVNLNTVCPGSLDPFCIILLYVQEVLTPYLYIACYYIKYILFTDYIGLLGHIVCIRFLRQKNIFVLCFFKIL